MFSSTVSSFAFVQVNYLQRVQHIPLHLTKINKIFQNAFFILALKEIQIINQVGWEHISQVLRMDLEIFVESLDVFQLRYVGVESLCFASVVCALNQYFPVVGGIPTIEKSSTVLPVSFHENAM